MLYFFIILTSIFFCLALFFGIELLKKFQFWKKFQNNHTNQISYLYKGDQKAGMYTIYIQGIEPFRVLIGFNLSLWKDDNSGYDVFGYMESTDNYSIEFSTYLGRGDVELIFLIDGTDSKNLQITFDGETKTQAKYIYKPHWWQRIGFFG